jgi:hypothetical protein
LDATLNIPAFGISLDYPSGWEAGADDSNASIIQNDGPDHHLGYQVLLEFTPLESYVLMFDLPEDLTVSDLYGNNWRDRGWWFRGAKEVTDVELFDVPAIRVRAKSNYWWEVRFSGVRNDEVFRLSFTAPSEEALDAFMPTVEQILDSIGYIKRTGGEKIIITFPYDGSTVSELILGNVESMKGTFEVIYGADVLGCEQGSFVEWIGEIPQGTADLKELTCESGERSGTFTVSQLLAFYSGGPMYLTRATDDFYGLSGEGEWFAVENEDEDIVVETLIGKIKYSPITLVEGMKASGDSIWVWARGKIWRYADNEWSTYADAPSYSIRDVEYSFGTLMVVAGQSLKYFDGEGWQIVPGSPQDPDYVEVDDHSGIVWAMAGNLYRWDHKEWTNISLPTPKPNTGFLGGDIVLTGDGILWTSDINFYFPHFGGVASYDDTKGSWEMVRPWRLDEDVPAQVMATTPNGDLWMILVDFFDNWEWHRDENISYVDWALVHRDVATGEWTIFDEDLPEGIPGAMVADDDSVWLAQGLGVISPSHNDIDGIVRFDGENWTRYLSGEEAIRFIAIAPDDTIWYVASDNYMLRQLR